MKETKAFVSANFEMIRKVTVGITIAQSCFNLYGIVSALMNESWSSFMWPVLHLATSIFLMDYCSSAKGGIPEKSCYALIFNIIS